MTCACTFRFISKGVARPLVLRELINAISSGQKPSTERATELIIAVAVVVLLEAWMGVQYRHILTEDVASTYVSGLFRLLLSKIVKTSATSGGKIE